MELTISMSLTELSECVMQEDLHLARTTTSSPGRTAAAQPAWEAFKRSCTCGCESLQEQHTCTACARRVLRQSWQLGTSASIFMASAGVIFSLVMSSSSASTRQSPSLDCLYT